MLRIHGYVSASFIRCEFGTCESFFCVRIESRIGCVESNFRIESAVYTMQAITPSNCIITVFVTNESDARN